MFDDAQLIEEREREGAIAAARAPVIDGRQLASAEDCRHCADPIPEERRRAVPGVQLCLACQESRERLQRLFGAPR